MAANLKGSNATVSTSLTAIYTAPALTTSTIISVSFANTNVSTTRTMSLVHYDSSGTSAKNIITNLGIPAEDTYLYNDKIVLEAGDELRAVVDVGSDLHAVISVLEQS